MMHTFLYRVFTVSLLLGGGLMRPAEEPGPQFNPSGYYSLAGKPRQGFEDIRWLEIWTAETKRNRDYTVRWVSVRAHGSVRTHAGKVIRLERVELNDDRLSFSTRAVKGVSYAFNGRFLERGVYYESEPKKVVLTGRLTRLHNGRAVLQSEVGLVWFGGD